MLPLLPRPRPPNEPSPPDFRHASVTLPYTELRGLWEAGLRKPVEPPDAAPVPFVVHRAEIRIALAEATSKIGAQFEVATLQQQWQRSPLLGGEIQLDKADAGERSIVWDDGYALLTDALGRNAVALHLATGGTAQCALPLKLTTGNASVKRLTVTGISIGLEARVNGEVGESIDGSAVFLIPG